MVDFARQFLTTEFCDAGHIIGKCTGRIKRREREAAAWLGCLQGLMVTVQGAAMPTRVSFAAICSLMKRGEMLSLPRRRRHCDPKPPADWGIRNSASACCVHSVDQRKDDAIGSSSLLHAEAIKRCI